MPFAAIILLSMGVAVAYGVLHNQVTATLCPEFYTLGHRLIPGFESPRMIALASGILATWWLGILTGFLFACCARLGRWPRLTPAKVLPPLWLLTAFMAACALIAGLIGHQLAAKDALSLGAAYLDRVPAEARHGFITNLYIHSASYLSALVGSLYTAGRILRTRWRLFQATLS